MKNILNVIIIGNKINNYKSLTSIYYDAYIIDTIIVYYILYNNYYTQCTSYLKLYTLSCMYIIK